MRPRRLKPVDPVPADLETFRVEQWLVLVDGSPSADFIEQSGGTCPLERWRRIQALKLWSAARHSWAQMHEWPGGTCDRLREDIAVRRAELWGDRGR